MRPSLLRTIWHSQRGAVTMIFALSSVMLFLTVGFVIDFGRYYVARNRAEHALDAAGLAVGASSVGYTSAQGTCDSSTSDYLPSTADKYFNSNYVSTIGTATATAGGSSSAPVQICQSSDGNTLVLSTVLTVPTTFMRVAGFKQLSSTVSSKINRGISGLELAVVLDNTGSMTETTSDGVVSLVAEKQATYALINSLWGQSASTDAISPAPAAISGLYVGIVPFTGVANVLNTNTNSSVGTTPYELLGSDSTLQIGSVVNTDASSSSATAPLCAYKSGSWAPASNDYVDPMDIIHLAQDLCAYQVSSTISSTNNGKQTWTSGTFQNLYIVDGLNSSTYAGMAWAGCVEARMSKGDTSSTPYRDYNTANSAGWTYSSAGTHGYDTDLTVDFPSTITPAYLWHIYRGTGYSSSSYQGWTFSASSRNPAYQPNPWLPNTASLTSVYYSSSATSQAIYKKTGGTTSYYLITPIYSPVPIYEVQKCATNKTTVATCSSSSPTFQAYVEYAGLSSYGSYSSGTQPTLAINYYWSAPQTTASNSGKGSNYNCIQAPILPLTNNYSDIASEIGPSSSQTTGMDDKGGTGTLADYAFTWAGRVLDNAAPFSESTAIEATTSAGAAGWKKAIVFMTDGNMNLEEYTGSYSSSYTTYGDPGNSGLYSTTDPWHQSSATLPASPVLAAYEDNSGPVNSTLSTISSWTSTPSSGCGWSTPTGNGTNTLTATGDSYHHMCRIYKICSALRAQNYYIYTVLFSHDANDTPSSDEGILMQQCTADGSGNVDTTKFFQATNATTLSAAFTAIGTQLSQLRVVQ